MEIDLNDEQKRLYSRLYVSRLDLDAANYSLAIIMKKGWHYDPWEKRGSIYRQQTVFTSALVVAYARPFNTSHGWPKFPHELMKFQDDEREVHREIIELRNSVCAHSDSKMYSVRPWRAQGFATDIIGAPVVRITATQGTLLREMIVKLQGAIGVKLRELVPE